MHLSSITRVCNALVTKQKRKNKTRAEYVLVEHVQGDGGRGILDEKEQAEVEDRKRRRVAEDNIERKCENRVDQKFVEKRTLKSLRKKYLWNTR